MLNRDINNLDYLDLPNLHKCRVAIIGIGYVGLPLAKLISQTSICFLTKKKLDRQVVAYDFNKCRVDELKIGFDRNNIHSKNEFDFHNFIDFTSETNSLIDCDIFIITVPTPLGEKNLPDLSFLKNASEIVGDAIKKSNNKPSQIVIYESTVYPGATEEVCIPIIENFSGKPFNCKSSDGTFYCGYSPERINPGDYIHNLESIKKVTSGSNKIVSNWIDDFYGSFISAGTFKASSIKVAESAKIIENTQRDINIALFNELAILLNKMSIDSREVFEAAATKWNFHKYSPGLVGGHCIGVDPYYLAYKANAIGYETKLISAGREINDDMHEYLLNRILIEIKIRKFKLPTLEVLLLGLSYKANCSDIRNSQLIILIEKLKKEKINVKIVDPLVDAKRIFEESNLVVLKNIPNNQKYPIIIFALAHKEFEYINCKYLKRISYDNSIIFDLTNKLNCENVSIL